MIRRYSKEIWVRFFGQFAQATGTYAIGPFLTLYLFERIHTELVATMLVVSISPMASLIFGVWGGRLADRYGKKRMMVLALCGQVASMLLFGLSSAVWQFVTVNVIRGLFNSLYTPAADAQIADLVSEDRRAEVYSLLHLGFNIGCALGPIIGLTMYSIGPSALFLFVGGAYGVTALLFGKWLTEPQTAHASQKPIQLPSLGAHKFRLKKYSLVLWITFWSLPIYLLYGQIQSTFPLHLSHRFSNFTHVYAVLLTCNAVLVIALQMGIARLTQRVQNLLLIAISFFSFGLVGFGYALAPSLALLLVTEFMFTIGEMIGFPQMQWLISVITPASERGTYFAIYALRWNIGMGLGPILGGLVMQYSSGTNLFLLIGLTIWFSGMVLVWTLLKKLPAVKSVAHHSAAT